MIYPKKNHQATHPGMMKVDDEGRWLSNNPQQRAPNLRWSKTKLGWIDVLVHVNAVSFIMMFPAN